MSYICHIVFFEGVILVTNIFFTMAKKGLSTIEDIEKYIRLLPPKVGNHYLGPFRIRENVRSKIGLAKSNTVLIGKTSVLEFKGSLLSKFFKKVDGLNEGAGSSLDGETTQDLKNGQSDTNNSSFSQEKDNDAMQKQTEILDRQNQLLQKQYDEVLMKNALLEKERFELQEKVGDMEKKCETLERGNANKDVQLDYLRAYVHDTRGLLMPFLFLIYETKNYLTEGTSGNNHSLSETIGLAERAYEKIVKMSNTASAVIKAVSLNSIPLNYRVISLNNFISDLKFETLGCKVIMTKTGDDYVEIDPDTVERIIRNLVDNAIKFSDNDPSTVTVVVDYTDDRIKILVRDKGIGIENVDNIFNMYNRGNNVSNMKGFGIGLAYCKMATEALGGSIIAENNASGGAMFTVSIPRRRMIVSSKKNAEKEI